jgi:molecular chaperone GrpE
MTNDPKPETESPEETPRTGGDAPETPETTSAEAPAAAPPDPAAQVAELKDRLLRALAENENVIRRARREREDTAKYAAAGFARDMLTVADNLGRAIAAVPETLRADETAKALIEGVELTEKELLAALERHGVRRIAPMGEKFNHDLHEALFEVPTDRAAAGTVVQVMEDGYVIHDRLLRAARVGVARALPAGNGNGNGEDDAGDAHKVDTTA